MNMMKYVIQQATIASTPPEPPPTTSSDNPTRKRKLKPKKPETPSGLATAKQRIVKFLEDNPGASKNRIMHVTRMKESTYLYAINILLNEKAIRIVATSHTHKHYLVV